MKYHNKLLVLFFIMWGFVSLERMVVGFVLPSMAADFNMNLTEAGIVVSACSFAYAIGLMVLGGAISSGYVGKRTMIVVLLLVGGVLSWVTGIVTSIAALILVRIVMGFCGGGIYPALTPTIMEESPEHVRGRNVGLISTGMMVIAAIAGPILSSQLLVHLGGWRPVFFVYAAPAVLLAILIWFVMREPASTAALIKARKEGTFKKVKTLDADGNEITLVTMLKNRNILLLVFFWICQMAWLWMITSFGIMYMVSFHHIPITSVGFVMAGFGIGGAIGTVFFGAVSDRFGRRRTLVLTQVIGTIIGAVFVLVEPGASLITIFILLLLWSFSVAGAAPMANAIPVETVGFALAGMAMGICCGIGEIVGGGIIPILGGRLGDIMGLRATMWLAVLLVFICVFLAFAMKEPKLAKTDINANEQATFQQ